MGTASLVIGTILIGFGFSILIIPTLDTSLMSEKDIGFSIIGESVIAIPLIVFGVFFLKKFDKDRKKEKNS